MQKYVRSYLVTSETGEHQSAWKIQKTGQWYYQFMLPHSCHLIKSQGQTKTVSIKNNEDKG